MESQIPLQSASIRMESQCCLFLRSVDRSSYISVWKAKGRAERVITLSGRHCADLSFYVINRDPPKLVPTTQNWIDQWTVAFSFKSAYFGVFRRWIDDERFRSFSFFFHVPIFYSILLLLSAAPILNSSPKVFSELLERRPDDLMKYRYRLVFFYCYLCKNSEVLLL